MRLGLIFATLLCGSLACAAPTVWSAQVIPAAADSVPLYGNLGDHHHPITTDSDLAQRYFDQGLRLQYAFNHAEAIRSYEEALRLDPTCAMCSWGVALAAGPNINAPMDAESGVRAWEAVQNARILAADATDVEAEYIEALALRYAAEPETPRPALDSAYASAMAGLADRHPADADAQALAAAALMNLSPWNYWEGEFGAREPLPGTEEILSRLERALELDPENPGACHYYIHAVEAALPERAVECADRLAALMPGAGHIVHMPGHIYIRVGRYADAVEANEHAVHADETYIADQRPAGLYPAAYYPHNYHFMAFAATMAGMSGKALDAARTVSPKVPLAVAREIYWIQNAIVLPQLTLVTFGRWDEVLDEPMPAPELATATALAHYARGTAHAARGEGDAAAAELQALTEMARAEAAASGQTNPVMQIAEASLEAEIALRAGRAEEAVQRFDVAREVEDALLYEEPPLWYYPVRHGLGRALLEAGRAPEAEERYREDLARFPRNGWALFGLAEALRAQDRDEEAKAVQRVFEEAWKRADVRLSSSRF